jgi:hypothetical protein
MGGGVKAQIVRALLGICLIFRPDLAIFIHTTQLDDFPCFVRISTVTYSSTKVSRFVLETNEIFVRGAG